MKRTMLAACLLLFAFAFNSCTKDDVRKPPVANPVNQEAVTKANDWLALKSSTADGEKLASIKKIKAALDFNSVRFEKLNEDEKLMIVPLAKTYQSTYNADKKPLHVLLLIVNKKGNIRKGHVVQYIAEGGKDADVIPENTFYNFYNNDEKLGTARFIFLNLSDKILYEINYKDGKLFSVTNKEKKSGTTNSATAGTCTDWYLVTYQNGVAVHEEYLYTTCTGSLDNELADGGGGGSGTSETEEAEPRKEISWIVYSPSSWFPSWEIDALVKLRGKRDANEPQGGHFTSVTSYGVSCSGCESHGVTWAYTYDNATSSPQLAAHHVIGSYTEPGSATKSFNKTVSFSFQSIFP